MTAAIALEREVDVHGVTTPAELRKRIGKETGY